MLIACAQVSVPVVLPMASDSSSKFLMFKKEDQGTVASATADPYLDMDMD